MPSIRFRMKYLTETKRTAVFETDDPLAPVSRIYVQKSWLAQQVVNTPTPIIPPAIVIEIERVEVVAAAAPKGSGVRP